MLPLLIYVRSRPVATCERRRDATPVARAHARRETRDAPNALKDTRTRESRWKIPLVLENRAEGESGAQVESGGERARCRGVTRGKTRREMRDSTGETVKNTRSARVGGIFWGLFVCVLTR